MPDAYTYISKPTGANYTFVNFEGKQTYDETNLSYDDSSTYYDSYNPNAWSEINKPSDGSVTIRAGMATGLVMPLTYATDHIITISKWTPIAKPN